MSRIESVVSDRMESVIDDTLDFALGKFTGIFDDVKDSVSDMVSGIVGNMTKRMTDPLRGLTKKVFPFLDRKEEDDYLSPAERIEEFSEAAARGFEDLGDGNENIAEILTALHDDTKAGLSEVRDSVDSLGKSLSWQEEKNSAPDTIESLSSSANGDDSSGDFTKEAEKSMSRLASILPKKLVSAIVKAVPLLAIAGAVTGGILDGVKSWKIGEKIGEELGAKTKIGGLASVIFGTSDLLGALGNMGRWAGIGAAAGAVIGPVGILGGALIGAGIGLALNAISQMIGFDSIIAAFDKITDKWNSAVEFFVGIDEKRLDARISSVKEAKGRQEKDLSEKERSLEVLQKSLAEAEERNDAETVRGIRERISVVEKDIERKKASVEEFAKRISDFESEKLSGDSWMATLAKVDAKEVLQNFASKISDGIDSVLSEAGSIASRVTNRSVEIARSSMTSFRKNVEGFVSHAASSIVGVSSAMIYEVSDAISNASKKAVDSAKLLARGTKEGTEAFVSSAISFHSNVLGSLLDAASWMTNAMSGTSFDFRTDASLAAASMKKGLGNAFSSLLAFFAEAVPNLFSEAFEGVRNFLRTGISDVLEVIKKFASSVSVMDFVPEFLGGNAGGVTEKWNAAMRDKDVSPKVSDNVVPQSRLADSVIEKTISTSIDRSVEKNVNSTANLVQHNYSARSTYVIQDGSRNQDRTAQFLDFSTGGAFILP